MTSTGAQVRPLLGLRWRMVRSSPARVGFVALAGAVPLLCLAAAVGGAVAPRVAGVDVLLLAPTAYLSVALLAVVAPMIAGGGNELFPTDQLTAFPVTARTQYVVSLLLTPLNLAWTAQLVGVLGLTAYIAEPSPALPLALVTCLAFVACVTVAGQALAWWVVGTRARREGRRLTWDLAALALAVTLAVMLTGNLTVVLDHAPTTHVVIGALNGAAGGWGWWASTTVVLVALTWIGVGAGRRLCGWALRQPGDGASRTDAHVVRRRPQRGDERHQRLAVDRASVWRSPPLRRGLLVLGILPGLAAAAAGLPWPSLVLLPALVAAGAGLLFGVNAFCLDGSGAVWLESLPGRPTAAFWSKAQVVGEVCVVAMVVTVVAGGLRSGRLPTTGEVTALAACSVTTLLRVVATCMELSVTRPHRAELRGPRDSPAPPGVMAAYSVRLALSTTLLALLFSALADVTEWQFSVLVALPFVLLSIRRLVKNAARWSEPVTRSRVAHVVSAG